VISEWVELNGEDATLDISSLASGVYAVNVIAEGKRHVLKLIVDK